jgi:hypothetical protein
MDRREGGEGKGRIEGGRQEGVVLLGVSGVGVVGG